MKIFYAVLILLAIYAVFVYGRFKYVVSHANLPDIRQEDRTVGTGASLRYIAAGDSTAVGEGASSVEKTYTYRLADYFAQTHAVEYRNTGVLGARTQDVVDSQISEIVTFNPDVVTVSIGANDLTHAEGKSKIIKNYQTIIAKLTAETHAKIYITDIPAVDTAELLPLLYRKYLEIEAGVINRQLLTMETDRVKVIDIHDFGWDQYADRSTTFAADKFHPNDEGYNNWTNAFLDKIK